MDVVNNLILGFSVALSWTALYYCLVGVTLGTLVGVLPGVGTLAAVALLMPLTFELEPTIALIMLAGIYYGAAYGGSTASILLNLPGTANTAVSAFEGYPMAKSGRAGVALFMTTIASFAGSIFGLIILMFFAPQLAKVALKFGSPEYFSLMVLGLLAASLLSAKSPSKALSMVVFGLLIGSVGTDPNSGFIRFSFGVPSLFEGFSLVAVVLGLFGMHEVISNAGHMRSASINSKDITLRSLMPTRQDWKDSFKPMARGGGLGAFFGALPGTGGAVATFVSYATERKLAKNPERFGNGAIEGLVGPETSNNAAIQTAFIPTLTLGIPGDVVMALILATLIIHGIQPGPAMIPQNPALFWGLAASFFVGNIMLLVLNIPMIGVWVRLLTIPYKYLFPTIIVFVCIGVYSINSSTFDVWLVAGFSLLGYFMVKFGFEPAPVLLGMILGPMLEEHLRRSMLISRGDPMVFIDRPISAIFLILTLSLISIFAWSGYRKRAKGRA
ncbi:tripartite tricarboxylate transporter permease [Ruegeria hyattellae]|uniref:tripartite tricarboxylate transporter permease n=1 Tax=Ruegeria hyattellae TaxID=3233337 RepID=UPI00355B4F86